MSFRQDIRFAKNAQGLRIAYAVSGSGYPIVRAGTWMSNVEMDWRTGIFGPVFEALSQRYCLYRYNPRGYGLSEGDGGEVSLTTLIADLEAVVDGAKLERFALWGSSSAGSLTSIAYAARHPERVSHLLLTAALARGSMREHPERFRSLVKLVELGWGDANPAFRQVQTTQMFPGATAAQIEELNELLRVSATPQHTARMVKATGEADVSALLSAIRCPTLVFHCRDALLMPVEDARLIASSLPNARFITLESKNYMPLKGESAFAQMMGEIGAFLPPGKASGAGALSLLTPREREVLVLLAGGLDNASIALKLDVSEKTVRNTLSHVFEKLDVRTRAQAIVLARRAGLGE